MKRKFAKYGLIVAAFGLYAIGFGEVFVRSFAPQAFVPRVIDASPIGVRVNRPGAVYRQRTPEVSAIVRINRQGMRAERDFPREKPFGVKRIAMFGDSYFLGYEAGIEDIAATRLEKTLRAAQCPVEVLNFAVSGFGTGEMLRVLEEIGLGYAPDVILFQWHHTDPDDNRRSALYKLEDSRLVRTDRRYTPAMGARSAIEAHSIYRWISENSHLFIIVRERGSRFVRRLMAGRVLSRQTTGGQTEERLASPTDLAIIAAAEEAARKAGARFFMVDVPSAEARTRFRSSFRLLPQSLTSRPNFISPIKAFETAASPSDKLYWEKGHRHLTPRGNEVLASVMAERLLGDPAAYDALDCRGVSPKARIAGRSR